jgi:hypothetical protein
MKTMNAHIARNIFNEKIVDLVTDYLENIDVYPEDSCIAVRKQTGDLVLLRAIEAGNGWEIYPIDSFIHLNEHNEGIEVDIIATMDLADKYYLIR